LHLQLMRDEDTGVPKWEFVSDRDRQRSFA
jgi:hypothetical protein